MHGDEWHPPVMTNMALEPGSEAAMRAGCTCGGLRELHIVNGHLLPLYNTDPFCPCHGNDEAERVLALLHAESPPPADVPHWVMTLLFWVAIFFTLTLLFTGWKL